MKTKQDKKLNKDRSAKLVGYYLVAIVIISVLSYAGALLFFSWPIESLTVEKSGAFGDSFGILTSLFSGLAFAGLIITIAMQRDELGLQREELGLTRKELLEQKEELKTQNRTMAIQRFENTFFKMLDLLTSCRSEIVHSTYPSPNSKGRDAIKNTYSLFINKYLYDQKTQNGKTEPIFKKTSKTEHGIILEYRRFHEDKHDEEITQYFRTLFQILEFVDSSDNVENKRLYADLLKSQIAQTEAAMIFYNCVSDQGKELKPLVKKYLIIDHLNEKALPAENVHLFKSFKNHEQPKTKTRI